MLFKTSKELKTYLGTAKCVYILVKYRWMGVVVVVVILLVWVLVLDDDDDDDDDDCK